MQVQDPMSLPGVDEMGFDASLLDSQLWVRLPIAGMTCESCARSIRETLLDKPGIRAAEVSLAAGDGIIRFHPDSGWTTQALAAAVEDMGFQCPLELVPEVSCQSVVLVIEKRTPRSNSQH